MSMSISNPPIFFLQEQFYQKNQNISKQCIMKHKCILSNYMERNEKFKKKINSISINILP